MWLRLSNASMLLFTTVALAQPCEPAWHPVGGGTSSFVSSMAVFPEQGAEMLFAGGNFTHAGGVPTGPVARWDGAAWSDLGGVYFDRTIICMIVHDDGTGEALYVGGRLRPVPGFTGYGVGRWDGVSWTAVGEGLLPIADEPGAACFAEFDDGHGPRLYAGGQFTVIGEPPGAGRNLARWDGVRWTSFAQPDGLVRSMVVHDGGGRPTLVVGGIFDWIGGIAAAGVAGWDGAVWEPMHGAWDAVYTYELVTLRSRGQERLYAGSLLYRTGQPTINVFARWTGADWEDIGAPHGIAAHVGACTAWDDGYGEAIYVGGRFTAIGGVLASNIARFDGSSWSALAAEYPGSGTVASVKGVASGPDGRSLYMGGSFVSANPGLNRIARYEPCTNFCHANCDGSTTEPILNIADFTCFINEYASGTSLPHEQQLGHYANCDHSTIAPVLNVDDFACFINGYARGCP